MALTSFVVLITCCLIIIVKGTDDNIPTGAVQGMHSLPTTDSNSAEKKLNSFDIVALKDLEQPKALSDTQLSKILGLIDLLKQASAEKKQDDSLALVKYFPNENKEAKKSKDTSSDMSLDIYRNLFNDNSKKNSDEMDWLIQKPGSDLELAFDENLPDDKSTDEDISHTVTIKDVYRDIQQIAVELQPWKTLIFQIFNNMKRVRDYSFKVCCEPSDSNQVNRFGDNYMSMTEHEKIIGQCIRSLPAKMVFNCTNFIEKVKGLRSDTFKLFHQFFDGSLNGMINNAIKSQIHMQNIIYNYDVNTRPHCRQATYLILDLNSFVSCEYLHRSKLAGISRKAYKDFDKKISKPFRNLVQHIFMNLKRANDEIIKIIPGGNVPRTSMLFGDDTKLFQNAIESSNLKAISDIPAPKPTLSIDDDMKSIKSSIQHYNALHSHPMIFHHDKRAHAYKVCCKQMETDDLFNQYLLNFNRDFTKMDQLLRSCLHKQNAAVLTDNTIYGGECQNAYNQLTEAMGQRQNYINKYKNENKDIIKRYGQAINPKLDQAPIIKRMKSIVNEYCPDQHVFELMFNPEQLIKCEELARKSIVQNSSEVYSSYNNEISAPFIEMIINDWKGLEKADADTSLITGTESTVPDDDNDSPAHSAISEDDQNRPANNNPLLGSLSGGTSWVIKPINRIFTIFLMIIIYQIFF